MPRCVDATGKCLPFSLGEHVANSGIAPSGAPCVDATGKCLPFSLGEHVANTGIAPSGAATGGLWRRPESRSVWANMLRTLASPQAALPLGDFGAALSPVDVSEKQ
eukprot:TRINITY_DN28940_c0_g1_i2.p2 TRINITY_DN28940_c0_g1~~TRINITY_DN28940_c0_g1_i2.p2  ORF type:complete len:113 (+),score=8.01 TRINITY_DN28940_c0_g1_i2:23-340(+)